MVGERIDVHGAVAALVNGDRAELTRLFDHFRPRLARLVSLYIDPKLRGRVGCADVLQEAFLDADRRVEEFLRRPESDVYVWLRGLTMQRLSKLQRYHLRTQRRAVARELPLPEQSSLILGQQLVARGSSPSQHLRKEELRQRVTRAVASLAERDREVILMRHFENLTNQQIAQVLDLQESASTMRYSRALYRLRKALLEEGSIGESAL